LLYSVVTQLQNYLCTKNSEAFSWISSWQPPSSRLEAKIPSSFPIKTLLQPRKHLRHGPQSGHHLVQVCGRTLTLGIGSALLTCRKVKFIP
jgi:hypothetical protein